MSVPARDKTVLRELAAQIAEIAALPVQQETVRLWQALNGLKPERPMFMIDQICWHEMTGEEELALRCESPVGRGFEERLRQTLYLWRHMRADNVVEPVVEVPRAIRNTGFGIQTQEEIAHFDPNGVPGHAYHNQMLTEADVARILTPEISEDTAATGQAAAQAHEIFDGLLEVRVQGAFPSFAPFDQIVQWMSPEGLLWALADRPEFVHQVIARLTEAHLAALDQLEDQGLLGTHQQTIHCSGAYTGDLPGPGYDPTHPRARDLWTSGMSQIFSTVSPAMHEEFELPYFGAWCERFGLTYYGCCEPLDLKIAMVRKLPRVRKVSMSPWVQVPRAAREVGADFVFSRKPSPAFLAVDAWNPAAVEADLRETLAMCAEYGCPVEFILKDISTVRYQPRRLWEWADVARRVVEG